MTSLLLKRFAICAPAHKAEDSEKKQRISDLEKSSSGSAHTVCFSIGISLSRRAVFYKWLKSLGRAI